MRLGLTNVRSAEKESGHLRESFWEMGLLTSALAVPCANALANNTTLQELPKGLRMLPSTEEPQLLSSSPDESREDDAATGPRLHNVYPCRCASYMANSTISGSMMGQVTWSSWIESGYVLEKVGGSWKGWCSTTLRATCALLCLDVHDNACRSLRYFGGKRASQSLSSAK